MPNQQRQSTEGIAHTIQLPVITEGNYWKNNQ